MKLKKYITEAKIMDEKQNEKQLITVDKKQLIKLIKDYGDAMYDAGENPDPDDKYYARQIGITLRKLTAYVGWNTVL